MRRPWFQFFPGDWMSDPGVRMSSLPARGLWLEMICIMHQASSPGYLEINGQPIDAERLANLVGARYDSVTEALQELLQNGVYDVDGRGCIYSRRMVRDEHKREGTRERVRRSRSKGQCNAPGNAPVTPDVTPLVTPPVTPVKHGIPKPDPDPKKNKSRTSGPPSDRAFVMADILIKIVTDRVKIKVGSRKRRSWADHIDRCQRIDGIDFDRQGRAMTALDGHWEERGWPEIQSGRTWRDKFTRLEAAMSRKPFNDDRGMAPGQIMKTQHEPEETREQLRLRGIG